MLLLSPLNYKGSQKHLHTFWTWGQPQAKGWSGWQKWSSVTPQGSINHVSLCPNRASGAIPANASLPPKPWVDEKRVCCCCLVAKLCPTLFLTLWTVALQAPLSIGFPRQEYWSGLPFSSPGRRGVVFHALIWNKVINLVSENGGSLPARNPSVTAHCPQKEARILRLGFKEACILKLGFKEACILKPGFNESHFKHPLALPPCSLETHAYIPCQFWLSWQHLQS